LVEHGEVAFATTMRRSIEMASALPSDKFALGHSRPNWAIRATSASPP